MMKKYILLALLITVLANKAIFAETLISPTFPDKGDWTLKLQQPIKAQDGADVGKAQFYFLSAVEENSPPGMVMITVLNRNSEIGPVEHMTNLAKSAQQQCETFQLTKPTHTIERGVPVSYARMYCSRIKQRQEGVIQNIKVLQGQSQIFTVVRQWATPPYSSDLIPSQSEAFATAVFSSTATARIWLEQMNLSSKHLETAITLCANRTTEFGAPCN